MENYESDIFMSQEGYASIDFTLLDRPNCNIASAPEATAALLPDVHVAESSFSSFDFLDGSGVDGLSGFSRGVDQNHSLELSRDDAEITRYKERTIHLSREVAGNGAAVPNLHQSQFQIPYAVQKPVSSSVDFLEKMPAKVLQQQQEQQSQLSLFNNEGRDENQDYLGSGQASQPSQAAAAGSSWWMPETPWMTNNNHQDQSPQVFNRAATQDQSRLIPPLRTGSSQTNSPADYTGAVFSNSQLVNSNNPGPSMYAFLPTNTNQASNAARLNSARVQTHQAAPTTTVKSLPRNSAYDFEGLLNGSGYQQQQGVTVLSNNMASPEQGLFGNANQESAQDQQQNQTMNKYEGQQNMLEASALKVSDYDSFGDDYVIKGQGQGVLGERIEEEEAQVWRQQPSPQQSQLNHYGSSHEDMHQQHQQQAQVHQHLHQQQQQSQHQLFSGNNQNHSQATGNQLQAFLSDNSLHDVPHQAVMQQPERAHPQIGLEHHQTLTQSGFQTVNNSNNNARNVMYSGSDPSAAGQGPAIGYLLGQDNSFSWQQLAMKASGHDHPLYASANSVKRDALGQALHPYASVQGNAMHRFYGGMGELPAAASSHVNRPIPRSLGMGPSALFGIEGQSEVFNIGDQADIQARKIQASRAKLLFGQTMQQQQAPPHPVKNPQGFSRNLHQNMFLSANQQQSMEELQSRHHHHHLQQQQQSVRTNAAQQQGSTPQVKLFAQSLTPLNPMQQNLMGGNNGAAVQQHHDQAQVVTALQQSSFNVLQARNQSMGASPSNSYYQQASSHAAGGNFLLTSAAADNVKQQQMWNSYALEPEAASQIEVPMELMTAGTTSDGMVKSQWTTGLLETQACADMEEGELMSERLKPQQTLWSTHNNLQQSPAGSVAQLDSRAPSMQSSHCSSQQMVGDQASSEFDGKQLNRSDLQPNSLQPGTTMSSLMDVENGRQQEMHSPHQEGSWHDHSLLQPRLQPPVAAPSNSSLEVFADIENPPQTNWKRAWRSVSDSEDTSELAEQQQQQQQQQNMIWGPSHQPNSSSHGGGSQSQVQLNPPDSRMSQSGWSVPQNSSQTEQLFPVANRQQQQWHNKTHQEQQILMPASPESGQVYHDVNGGHQPSNQVPNFPQGMRHPSQFMTDKDSTSASGQGAAALSAQEHGYYLGAYPQSNVSRDQRQNNVHNSVGSSSGSQDSLHYTNSSGEAHPPQQQGGGSNGWSHQIFRQSLENPALSNMDLRQQQQGPDNTSRVQLQLSNNQTENSFSALMKAKGAASLLQEDSSSAGAGSGMSGFKPLQPAGIAAATHRHQNQLQRMRMLNRMSDEALALWTQSQFAAGQMRMEQSMLVGKALESSGIIGKDYSMPLRDETTMEGTLRYPENVLAQRARLAGMHGATFKNSGLLSNVTDARTSSEPGMLSGSTLELLSKQEEDRRTMLQAEALKDQEAAMEANAVDASGISPAHLHQGTMGTLLQRPIPSHPESLSRELELQLARNQDGWPQGRRLLNEYRQDSQAYGQQQQQEAATQRLHAGPLQSNVSHGDQCQGSQDRGDSGSMLFPAARLLPHDLSRQAAFIYKNLTPAARIQFASQFAQQFARASGTLQSFNPRSSAAQHLSRVGYDRASTSTWVNPVKPDTAAAPAPAAAGGQGGYKWPTEEQPRAPHVAEAAPITPPPPKKQKQEPRPFVPWRIAIRQATTHFPTISRSEIEWAAATNCLPEQDVFNEVGPEPSDVTALCMKRARRRLKLTTQLMQQLVPALPCRLFKGSTPEDQDNTVFLIAKFAVTEACLLATGVSKEQSVVTIQEDRAPNDSSRNHTSEKMQQQTALVKNNIRPAMPEQLQIHLRHRMTQLNNELARMENAPSALKLARDCSDLDKLGVVTRLERFHPGILAEYRNSTGNVRAKQIANVEANLFSHSLRPFLERPISAVAPPTLLPENVLLRSL